MFWVLLGFNFLIEFEKHFFNEFCLSPLWFTQEKIVFISSSSPRMLFSMLDKGGVGDDLKFDPNDTLAIDVMRLNNIKDIYSFDEDFDKIEEYQGCLNCK